MADAGHVFLDDVRRQDPWRYPALLFLQASLRDPLAVLYAFNAAIARIPGAVREPAAGSIRLQWWREALSGERRDEAASNPLSSALLAVIDDHGLPVDRFIRFLDAREFDLYNDPMPDRATLEGWLGETESFLFHMACRIAGAGEDSRLADACGHAGVAYGSALILRLLPFHHSRHQCYLPGDLLSAAGLDLQSWFAEPGEGHARALAGFLDLGREHLEKADRAIAGLPKETRRLFLPLSPARQALAIAGTMGGLVLTQQAGPGPLALQWGYWKAALKV